MIIRYRGGARWAVLGVLFFASEASANCLDPMRPGIESEGGVTRLNSYATGSEICIAPGFLPQNDCTQCKENYYHQCTARGWVRSTRTCGVVDDSSGSQGSNSRINMNAAMQRLQQQRNGQQQAIQQQQNANQQTFEDFVNGGGDSGNSNPGFPGAGSDPGLGGDFGGGGSGQQDAADIEQQCPGVMNELMRRAQQCQAQSSGGSAGMCRIYTETEQCFRGAASIAARCSHPAAQAQAREYERVADQARQGRNQVCAN